jgi:hypothetical protein
VLGRDGVAGLVCLGGSGALFAQSFGLPHPPLVPIGPAFYPRILLGVTIVLGAALVVADFLHGRREPAPPARYRLVVLTFAVFGGYVFLLRDLGYRLATFGFVLVLQAVLDPPRGGRRWGLVLAVALATAGVTHFVFEGYLSVLLPRGRLTGF